MRTRAGEPAAAEAHVAAAVAGDLDALDAVLRAVQGDVYNLAVRMLWCPEDAADATQEILIQVATHLSTFRGESALRTWVWRIATRHVLSVRRSRVEREEVTFSAFGEELATGLSDEVEPDEGLLEQEVMVGCTTGMLLCLDRDHRIAYVLGEVFEVTGDEAADLLGITAAAYRKRLSRARERIREFMRGHCGLVDPSRPCRCARRVPGAVASGRVRPDALLFAGQGPPRQQVQRQVQEMTDLHRIASIYRSHPDYAVPQGVLEGIRETLRSGRHTILA